MSTLSTVIMDDTKKDEVMQLENASDTLVCQLQCRNQQALQIADNDGRRKTQRKPNTTPGSTTSPAFAVYAGKWICESYLFVHCKTSRTRDPPHPLSVL
jgi:hypothetical protein